MAGKRKAKTPKRDEVLGPSKWRLQHGGFSEPIREADAETGSPVQHRRAVDTLGMMLANGTITQEMHDAGGYFRALFRRAALVLPEFLMQAYTDEGDVVFEPFGGSGTTILAGERTGRGVRAIELAPTYVDLAIARWRMLHPDLPVTLADDGRDHDAVAAARQEITASAA